MILFNKIKDYLHKKIMYFHTLALTKKLVYIYILIIAIPVLSLSFFTFYSLKDSFYKQIFNDAKYSVDIISNNINYNIETFQRIENVISTNSTLIDFLSAEYDIEVLDIIDFVNSNIKELERLQFSNPKIKSIRIFTNNEHIMERWSVLFKEDRIRHSTWYKLFNENKYKEYWQFNHIDDIQISAVFNSASQVSYYKELLNPKKQHIGYLQLSMNSVDFFTEMYKSEDYNSTVF